MSIIMYKQRFAPPSDRFTPTRDYLHVGYIAMRPRSVRNRDGAHGLFGYLSPTEPCDKMPWQETAKHIRQLSKRKVNIFRSVISFDRPDAEERGLVTHMDWREYAEQHMRILAEKNGISIANLGWCGAFHDEGSHPHLHIVFWDKAQTVTKNYVSPKICNEIRIALIKSTYADKIQAFYEQKKLAQENIGGGYGKAVSDFDAYMKTMRAKNFKAAKSGFDFCLDGRPPNIAGLFDSNGQLAEAAERLFRLRGMMPKGGRVAYKLLPPEAKAEVDNFADTLISGNTFLKAAIEQYADSLCNLKSLYSSLKEPDKLKAYRSKCEAEAKKQVSHKIVKSIKAIISREHSIREADYTAAMKKHFAMELMRGILDFFARSIVSGNSEWQEKQSGGFGEMSDRAMKEWYLKNKDKGMEF